MTTKFVHLYAVAPGACECGQGHTYCEVVADAQVQTPAGMETVYATTLREASQVKDQQACPLCQLGVMLHGSPEARQAKTRQGGLLN